MSRIASRSLLVAAFIALVAIAWFLSRSFGITFPTMEIDPAEAAHAGEERFDNALGMKFRRCPPGRFLMGDPRPGVPVMLRRGFWMGQFEVTQSQWQAVMGVTLREQRAKDPRQPRPVGDDTMRDHVGEGPDHPIYFVSYDDAVEFCRKFTEEERKAGRLPGGFEYRLPTEAQWEFACRAGTTTANAFGDALGGVDANFDGTKPYRGAAVGPYLRETTPGGHYPANAWGLHDMHGNVWEWCLDGYIEEFPGGVDPIIPISGPRRSYRGGCWHNYGVQCLSTSRTWGNASDRGSGLGFRVALVPTGP
jgi:formylglycine-generating enzyme required for sulfatase activity